MNIIITGIQGSGKGTHGLKLSNDLKIPHISFGDVIRKHLENDINAFSDYTINDYKDGKLAPDNVLFKIAETELKKSYVKRGFILDGFPRTPGQHQYLVNNFLIDVCIELLIPEEVAIDRLLSRGRVDDTEKGIKKRISQFKTQTKSLFNGYRKNGTLISINTNQSIESSYQEILNKINPFLKK